MARQSTQSRPSLWPGAQLSKPDTEECSPHLLSCVEALDRACHQTYRIQNSLRDGARDLPRMSRILDNERLFLVVNESRIKQYARQLSEEVEPQILELLSLAERGLKDLEKTSSRLQTKVESLEQHSQPSLSATSRMEMRRLNMLASQRERLKKIVDALEAEIALLESEQTES